MPFSLLCIDSNPQQEDKLENAIKENICIINKKETQPRDDQKAVSCTV